MGTEKDIPARAIGRYVLFREVAHGGMATVHLGRLRGPAGFARTVAIKRLHPQYARDPEFVSMFLDEARLAARVQHPNVVSVLDVVAAEGELFLVMDYVHGESFGKLQKLARDANLTIPPRILAAIACNVLDGLHAAHDARSERGDPLHIVHRDVSPQNVMVGADGAARVLDFGIAKAAERAHSTTREGQMKGKVPYMAPEQIAQGQIDRRTDVYAASVMLWEALTQKRLFPAVDVVQLVQLIMSRKDEPPSRTNPAASPELDAVVLQGLSPDPDKRWATAHDMAVALEKACPPASAREVGEWVRRFAEVPLGERAKSIAEIENAVLPAPPASSTKLALATVRAQEGARPSGEAAGASGAEKDRGDAAGSESHSPPPVTGATEVPAGVPPRGRARWLLAGGAGGFVVVLLLALGLSSGRAKTPAKAAELPSSMATQPAAPAIPPPPPLTAEPGAPTAVAVAPAAMAPTAAPVPSPRLPAATPARRARPGRSPAHADCSPPYTIDANGVRIPKRQCL